MSMDSNGKIIFAKHSEISQANLKNLTGTAKMITTRIFIIFLVCKFISNHCKQTAKNTPNFHKTHSNIVLFEDYEIKDGERIPLAIKDMGSCEIFPQTLSHNPNGRYDIWFY